MILIFWGFYSSKAPPFGLLWAFVAIYFYLSAFRLWKEERRNRENTATENEQEIAKIRQETTQRVNSYVAQIEQVENANKLSPAEERFETFRRQFVSLPDWAQKLLGHLAGPKGVMVEGEAVRYVNNNARIPHPLAEINKLTGGWLKIERDIYSVNPLIKADIHRLLRL